MAIDWILIVLPLVLIAAIALYTRRFLKSVADFLAGGRCAGRYLIANAFGESASGVANTLSKFEMYMVPGFTIAFWSALILPIQLLVAVSGFVVYRYRQTRALTLAQFFEMRYSRKFRLFMGMLAFVAGILNYGIFPAVSARFFVYFMGLPHVVAIFGMHLQTTSLIMACYLTCVVLVLVSGGHITQMVAGCYEGDHLARRCFWLWSARCFSSSDGRRLSTYWVTNRRNIRCWIRSMPGKFRISTSGL